MLELVQATVNGIMVGGVYAIVSVGLTLVFGVMDIVNFAQADFLMWGMFIAYFLAQAVGVHPVLTSVICLVVVFVIGALMQRWLVQPVLKAPVVSQIFLTVGLSFILQSTAQMLFGPNFRSVTTPYQTTVVSLGPVQVSVPYLLAFSVSALIAALLWLLLEHTDLGRAIRATAQNRTAAVLVGIHPERTYAVAFGLGTGLAAAAGAVILPYAYVFPTVGQQYGLVMFTVVVLGGMGSVPGALIGGLVVGIIHSLSAVFLPTQLQNLMVFAVFILTLMLRPAGLMGRLSTG